MSDIPNLLVSVSGEKIDSVEKWEKFRRPEIISLFENFVYGVRPVDRPRDLSFEIVKKVENFRENGIEYNKINISFHGYSFPVHGYIPMNKSGKVPAFVYVMHEFQESKCDLENSIECENVDIRLIIARGYAVFILPTSGIAPDWPNHTDYTTGVYTVFESREDRKPNSWATISAWSWGTSRVLDYIETDSRIDASRVTVAGHSRGGKTALWAAAEDKRFFCAISNASGCTGAAMLRTKGGERVDDINVTDWFCANYHNYNKHEKMLPVDQHMLIAAIAPRLCYVASCSEDDWADPEAERLSCRMAGEVYALYGKKGVVLPDEPVENGRAYHDGTIGYHVKSGPHLIVHEDWKFYLDFLDAKSSI